MADLLRERTNEGTDVMHVALRPNDAEATWTPIACGGGIGFPGTQSRGEPTCPDCIEWLSRTATHQGG